MTHYRMQDGVPVGIILAKNPRSGSLDELKTYNENTIYLNDGNEFQIRLFNPLQQKIGVLIGLNGEMSKSYLVLNPGQDVTIDRFIDSQKKMLFETYQYDSDNKVAQNAVAKNGIVNIQFFKEYSPVIYTSGVVYTTNLPYYNSGTPGNIYLNSTLTNSNGSLSTDTITTQSLNLTNISNTSNTTISGDAINTSSFNLEFKSEEPKKSYTKGIRSKMKETGRVSRGSSSSQSFERTDAQFEVFPFHEIIYNLKPYSEKEEALEVREYCTECGYRLRNGKWNYCPKCGEKI